ncbi:MAG: hypothetical protein WCG27_09160 [Pseudomonadota bacterium]
MKKILVLFLFITATSVWADSTQDTYALYIDRGFCGCLHGNVDLQHDELTDCASFCAGKDVSSPTLFGEAILNPDLELDPAIGNLYNWCYSNTDGQITSHCYLEVQKAGGIPFWVSIDVRPGSHNFTSDISALRVGTSYTAKLVEIKSNAYSNSFYLLRR